MIVLVSAACEMEVEERKDDEISLRRDLEHVLNVIYSAS
jgi:hypothetical protein